MKTESLMTSEPIDTNEFEVSSDLAEISLATHNLFKTLAPLNISDSDRFDIRLCFEEILINGMKHGNKFVKEIPVKICVAYNEQEVYISVMDSGTGFNPNEVKDPTIQENIHASSGRGVYLIKHMMDKVRYGAKGSCAEILKIINKK